MVFFARSFQSVTSLGKLFGSSSVNGWVGVKGEKWKRVEIGLSFKDVVRIEEKSVSSSFHSIHFQQKWKILNLV